MSNSYFQFKEFRIDQDQTAMKVTTDGCMLGAWAGRLLASSHGSIDSAVPPRLLDIGTGTGLLSLMIAQVTNHRIDAVELDDQAAIQALANTTASKWKDRIQVLKEDIRDYKAAHPYDYIISNPPFYENELKSGRLQKDMAHHDGGLTLKELFQAIDRNLSANGKFILLHPYKRKQDLELVMQDHGFHAEQLVQVRQSYRHNPFRLLISGSRSKPALLADVADESVRAEGNEYSEWFSDLLKPYYLNL